MKDAVKSVYNRFIRSHTPRKIAVFNGVAVRGVRLFDATDVFPKYEQPLIAAIRSQVDRDDFVVVVGGGRGVSSVWAARCTGVNGSVDTYEGSRDRVKMARETAQLNGADGVVTVRHAIVGEAIQIADEPSEADSVGSDELPVCDVLVLDCEGAELGILEKLEQRPPSIIVETHGFLESPEEKVRQTLSERGYEVVDRGVERDDLGVYVLTAVDVSS